MPTLSLPSTFTHTITTIYGDQGRQWLANLPTLIKTCEQRWSLTLQPPFELTFNYVAPAIRADGTPIVLKAGPPGSIDDELQTLLFWNGRGAVRVLEHDAALGVMLLERLTPGTPLATLQDDESTTRIFAQVAQQIAQPPPTDHNFDPIEVWGGDLQHLRQRYNGGTGPLPPKLVEQAEGLFAELLPSQGPRVLLHGDLHHWNILSAGNGSAAQTWLAIDPQGKIGEPCFEVSAWLRNPIPGLFDIGKPDPARLLARRIDILTETLGFDRYRMIGWGLARAVLSAWWSIEDTHNETSGWQEVMHIAEILSDLLI